MKTHMSKKGIVALAAIVALVLGTANWNPSNAADKNAPVQTVAAQQQLDIKYAGEKDGYVYLRIITGQSSDQKATLKISDLTGEKLFEETVSTKAFTRVIKLSPDEVKGLEITFAGKSGETKKQFAINAATTTTYALSEVAE